MGSATIYSNNYEPKNPLRGFLGIQVQCIHPAQHLKLKIAYPNFLGKRLEKNRYYRSLNMGDWIPAFAGMTPVKWCGKATISRGRQKMTEIDCFHLCRGFGGQVGGTRDDGLKIDFDFWV